MRCYVSAACALSVLVALSYAAPMPQGDQVIDNVIQNVTSTAFRVIGRAVLQSGGLGGGGGRSGGGGESRVSVVLPTFGPDDDDYDDEEEDANAGSSSSSSTSTTTTEASSSSSNTQASTTSSTTTTTTTTTTDEDLVVRVQDIRVPTQLSNNEDNEINTGNTEMTLYTSPASDSNRTKRDAVRTIRAAEDEQDQDASASGGNGPSPSDDLSNVDADDADRDKRYLPAGGSFGAHIGGGGSTGGSGNFLFDIIRRTADGAARAAGTVYRMIAGTENLGLGLTATSSSSRLLSPQLIAGSGATEESDEKENAPVGAGGVAEIDVAKSVDGYTEGIPGPITRLFVLANRGLANLVQDLILRLAQTSERIVNFKARLITALI